MSAIIVGRLARVHARPSARRAAAASARWRGHGRSRGGAGRRRAGCARRRRRDPRRPTSASSSSRLRLRAPTSSRASRGRAEAARRRAFAWSVLCMPTRTFSSAVMFANSRMFWNVRPIPAWTMSLGWALRKIPTRSSRRRYQRGPDDRREEHGERARGARARRQDARPSRRRRTASSERGQHADDHAPAATQTTGSSQARTGRAIRRWPCDLDVAGGRVEDARR